MVVLSAAICTKSGKALLSRQFVEMTRIRIEGLLAAFPKLMGTDSKQHTFVETDTVRYVYQAMDSLYLLLITNRASNIVEDLETLRLLSKVIPNVAGTTNNLSEEKVVEKSFELIFAFDEVLTSGGYRESITLQQIRTNMEMESHEEKLHNMIKLSKMEGAKDKARDAERKIRESQKEAQKLNAASSNSMPLGNNSETYNAYVEPAPVVITPTPSVTRTSGKQLQGMQLTGKKSNALEDALVKEDKLAPMKIAMSKTSTVSEQVYVQPAVQHPIMMVIAEKVTANITRDSTVDLLEIKGGLTLTAATDEAALCSVQLKQLNMTQFSFNTHPKVNKALYEKSGLLQLKDTTKGFPSQRPVGILKWTYSGSTDEYVPLKINCWPEEESRGQMNVSIEYSMDLKDMELHDVTIRIPLGTSDSPNILSVDGSHRHNASAQELLWEISLIDRSNASGSLEFTILQKNSDAFFPITVGFSSQSLFCNVEVQTVKSVSNNQPIQYGLSKSMSTEEYTIG
eukprot:gene4625-6504_t